jgi:hypothetical protein
MNPTLAELRHDIDHFHIPDSGVTDRDTWAEWHYFNVLSSDRKRWAFISFIVAGDVKGEKWGGSVTITLREEGSRSRRFENLVPRTDVEFSTTSANLQLGTSSVTVVPKVPSQST